MSSQKQGFALRSGEKVEGAMVLERERAFLPTYRLFIGVANIFAVEKQATLSFVDMETKMLLVSIKRVNAIGVVDGRDGLADLRFSEKPKYRQPKKQQKLNIWKLYCPTHYAIVTVDPLEEK